ncbi:MAG: hypothetical protein SFU98_07015 [Leptospiraceae bacterium]|nr:hypothetical protein [Leptospiraceae bacterium]
MNLNQKIFLFLLIFFLGCTNGNDIEKNNPLNEFVLSNLLIRYPVGRIIYGFHHDFCSTRGGSYACVKTIDPISGFSKLDSTRIKINGFEWKMGYEYVVRYRYDYFESFYYSSYIQGQLIGIESKVSKENVNYELSFYYNLGIGFSYDGTGTSIDDIGIKVHDNNTFELTKMKVQGLCNPSSLCQGLKNELILREKSNALLICTFRITDASKEITELVGYRWIR